MLEAGAEAKRALARLTDTHAECGEQHKAVFIEIEAEQFAGRDHQRTSSQQQTVYLPKWML